MKPAVLLRERSVPKRVRGMFGDRETLIWHRRPGVLFCSCAGSLLLSLGKAYDTKEAPGIDFTACIHV